MKKQSAESNTKNKLQNPKRTLTHYRSMTSFFVNEQKEASADRKKQEFLKRNDEMQTERGEDRPLNRWKSNPNLLAINSYIKLKDSETINFSSLIENMQNSIKTPEKKKNNNSINTSLSKNQKNFISADQSLKQRFTRKNPWQTNFIDNTQRQSSISRKNDINEQNILQKQLEIQKSEIQLLTKSLESKNKKIKDYEKLIESLKKQNTQKCSELSNKIEMLANRLSLKNKENSDLREQINELTASNDNLSKRIEELLNQPSFYKDNSRVFNLDEVSDLTFQVTSSGERNALSSNQFQEILQQKNYQIYELRKNIQMLKIKQHCLEAQHQEKIKFILKQNNRKYFGLAKKCKDLESQKRAYELRSQAKYSTSFLSDSVSDFDFSFSPDE